MTLPPLSEKDFLAQVTELAAIRGWSWLHLRPGMTRDSWRTPISGPLGKGWPDLVLVRAKDKRLLFLELKAEDGKVTTDQRNILDFLHSAGLEAWILFPSDWPEIETLLQ